MRPDLRIYFWYTALLVLLVVLQVTFVPLISVWGIQPSLPLVGLLFIGLKKGAAPAMLYAFPSGLLIDLYMGEVVGISALALVVSAFTIGFFFDDEKSALVIRSPRAVLVAALAGFVFSAVYVFAYFQNLDFHFADILLKHVLGATIFTTILSAIPVLILASTGSRLKV
jgi:rod shape-determining protein MreD